MADKSFTYDVFLSHNSEDKPRVRKLAERLKEAGLRVWFDEWVIKPGDDIYIAVERGLTAARVQVLCLSPAALGSDWVTLERSTVLSRQPTNEGNPFLNLLFELPVLREQFEDPLSPIGLAQSVSNPDHGQHQPIWGGQRQSLRSDFDIQIRLES